MRAILRGLTDMVGIPYGATLLVFLVALMLSFVLPSDSPVERVLGAPFFGLPITVGAVSGYLINKKWFSWTAAFAWSIPAVVFWVAYRELTQPQNLNPQPWRNLIGADCGSSECMYELLATAPLVCALAYSVTSLVAWLYARRAK